MANERQLADFVDFGQLGRLALDLQRLRQNQRRNTLTELSLGLREQELTEAAEQRRVSQSTARLNAMSKLLDTPEIPLVGKVSIAREAMRLVDVDAIPTAEEFMAAPRLFGELIAAETIDERNDVLARMTQENPTYTLKLLEIAEKNNRITTEQAQLKSTLERDKAQLDVLRARKTQIENQADLLVTRQEAEAFALNQARQFEPELNRITGELQAEKLRATRKQNQAWDQFVTNAAVESVGLGRELVQIDQDIARMEALKQRADLGLEVPSELPVSAIEGRLAALKLERDFVDARRNFLQNPNKETFGLFKQAAGKRADTLKSLATERQKVQKATDDTLRQRREQLIASTQRKENIEDAIAVGQRRLTEKIKGERDPLAIAQIAGEISAELAKSPEQGGLGVQVPVSELLKGAPTPRTLSVGVDLNQLRPRTVADLQEELLSIPTTIETIDRLMSITTDENIGVVGGTRQFLEGVASQFSALPALVSRKVQRNANPEILDFKLFSIADAGAFDALMNSLAFEIVASRQSAQSISDKDIKRITEDELGFGKTFPSAADIRNRLRIIKERLQSRQQFIRQVEQEGILGGGRPFRDVPDQELFQRFIESFGGGGGG